ncbi:MAG TPA: FAD-dependent thymidylate synthase [Thermotogota bacterium]|nr:FAD-dependent thymidylate synthase [Thermotogota bacterium]HPJ89098.1 FAD-dependent thymidylate synthase [Thermotogota bacterium]HPR96125.1 FAD-dependent thymidylate synthase [Thermotogota bacterium]
MKVLDKGFVELIDFMGSDLRAVEAARVSFQKGLTDEHRDRKLIEYLMENGHESPFEHIVFTFRVKAPLFVARQWFRHRISSFNEISGRYSVIKHEFYYPENLRVQDTVNRQGSLFGMESTAEAKGIDKIRKQTEDCYNTYEELLSSGIAREMARMVLPVNIYTQWFWTINARSLMNFLNLRADSHAQFEIQEYATKIAAIFREKCPWTYDAFIKYFYKGDLLNDDN